MGYRRGFDRCPRRGSGSQVSLWEILTRVHDAAAAAAETKSDLYGL